MEKNNNLNSIYFVAIVAIVAIVGLIGLIYLFNYSSVGNQNEFIETKVSRTASENFGLFSDEAKQKLLDEFSKNKNMAGMGYSPSNVACYKWCKSVLPPGQSSHLWCKDFCGIND